MATNRLSVTGRVDGRPVEVDSSEIRRSSMTGSHLSSSRRRLLQQLGVGSVAGAVALLPAARPRHTAQAQPNARIEPNAGSWKTWLLSNGNQFRPGPPPDSATELAEVKAMAGERAAMRDRIAYWEAGAAGHRWTEIFVRYANVTNFLPAQFQGRTLALTNVAIHDAMIATWDAKYAYNRPRPTEVDASFNAAVPVPNSPSYPSEHAAAAYAAATLLAALYPKDAQMFMDLAEEAGRSRVAAGVQFPSDVTAGAEIGRKVGELAVARSNQDDLNAVWDGQVPEGPGLWKGTNPPGVLEQNWKPLMLAGKDALRPAPPPAPDSDARMQELAEVKNFARTPRTNGIANAAQWGWYGQPATHFVPLYQIHDRALEYHLEHNAPWVARAYAAVGAAWLDAYIASQDAKYFYWVARPNMFDSSITTVIPNPNFPSYISNGAVLAGIGGVLLSHFFPRDAAQFIRESNDYGDSRLWAGIHFPSDIEVGKQMGKTIAQMAIDRMRGDG